MVIYLTGEIEDSLSLDELTPRQIVSELDKHVVGQAAAKRSVAVALRNRIRRQKLPPDLAQDVMPKNIIMIGSTGVGKTEIARRLARLSSSPFLKVEASKFTEVGYVGRDVESMIRDLAEIAIDLVRAEKIEEIADKAEQNAEERILDMLLPPNKQSQASAFDPSIDQLEDTATAANETYNRTREKLRKQLHDGRLDSRIVEMEVREKNFPSFEIYTNQGIEEMDINIRDMMPGLFGGRTKSRKMRVDEALEYLIQEEEQKLVDMDQVARIALDRVESSGIIFLDEIDKIAGREAGHGPDVSREGVQRDILPIAAGAFHVAKPSDLIPELQGRFPIRVELQPLTIDDFKRILTEPKNALLKQYRALMETEGITLDFTDDAVDAMARFAFQVNETTEDIGARRLQTILEKVLDEISFEGSDLKEKHQVIDAAYVHKTLADIVKNEDLSRYIL